MCFLLIKTKNGISPLMPFKSVRIKGVEPPRLAALDPKSSVSTNSTIPAFKALLLKKQFANLFNFLK